MWNALKSLLGARVSDSRSLKPNVKALWLKALRSGAYRQGTEALRRNPDTYCCLGVLCDLHARHAFVRKKWQVNNGAFTYEGEASLLPATVLKWSGLSYSDSYSLVRLNDTVGYNFEAIANFIEQTL